MKLNKRSTLEFLYWLYFLPSSVLGDDSTVVRCFYTLQIVDPDSVDKIKPGEKLNSVTIGRRDPIPHW